MSTATRVGNGVWARADALDRLNRASAAQIAARDALKAAELEAARAADAVVAAEQREATQKAEQHAAAYRELKQLRLYACAYECLTVAGIRALIVEACDRVDKAGT